MCLIRWYYVCLWNDVLFYLEFYKLDNIFFKEFLEYFVEEVNKVGIYVLWDCFVF